MKLAVRIFVICLATFVLLIGAAVGIGIYKPKSYEGLYNWVLYKNTGYHFTIEDISIQFSPTKVLITDLVLHNPEWEENSQLLRLGNAELTIQLSKFFRSELPYWGAQLNNSNVFVTKDDLGNSNWITSILASKKTESDEPLQIEKLFSFSKVNVKNSKIIHVQGELTEELELSSLSLNRTDQPSVQIQGMGLYGMEQVEIDGEVSIDSNDPSGQTVQIALQAKGLDIDLQANGTINPNKPDEANAYLNAKSESLDALEDFLKEKIPDVEPVSISLQLTSSKGAYEASKIQIQFDENLISGGVLLDSKNNSVRVNLASDSLDFTPYFKTNDESSEGADKTVITQMTKVDASEIESTTEENELDWTWKSYGLDVDIKVGEIIANQHSIKDFSASFNREDKDISIESIKGRYEQTNREGSEQTFRTDLIEISGTMQPLGVTTQVEDVILSLLISEGDSKIVLDGTVNLNGIEGTALKIDAKASTLDTLSRYFQKDFTPYLPASVSVNIETSDIGLKIEDLVAQSKESDLSGDMTIDWSNEKVKISGALSSQLIDVSPLQKLETLSEDVSSQQEKEIYEDKVFSDEEIDWSWLSSYDIDLDVEIKKFVASTVLTGVFGEQAPDNVFHDVIVKVDLNNGELKIDSLTATLAGGKVDGTLLLGKIEEGAKFEIKSDFLNLRMEDLGAFGDSVVQGGVTDVLINFSGQGKSPHQFASSLNGEIVFEMQEATMDNKLFELIGTDLFLNLINTLSPFVKEEKTTEFECVAIKFLAEDGVLTSKKQMAIESSRMKIVGSGKIDMHTEKIAIGFTPIAKKGIGVNVSNVVKFVYLGGTLSSPQMENDPVGIAKSGVAISTALATGGLSLIAEGLFKRVTNAEDICKRALEDSSEELEENIPSNMRHVTDQPEDSINATQ